MTTSPLQAEAEVDAKPQPDDERLWSVTTILKAFGDSQALIEWSAGAVADTAIRSQKAWLAILEESGPDEARKWLVDSRYRPARGERSATKLGTAVHAAVEILTVTGRRPEHGDPPAARALILAAALTLTAAVLRRPVLLAMMAFGNRHFPPDRQSVRIVNERTGEPVDPVLVDPAT